MLHSTIPAFNHEKQLQWLVDTPERATQYDELAKELGVKMRISLEIDVGLHRGGFDNNDDFRKTLQILKASENLSLSGLMGYEAHITKIPSFLGGPEKAFRASCATYDNYTDIICEEMGEDALSDLVLNTGGSSTYPLYDQPGKVNEIATASALVKPTDFDVYTLDHHLPATFIATPVLKVVKDPEFPMARLLSTALRKVGMLPRKACFIYGGNWLASPCWPANSKRSDILGHSSNQEMYELKADDNINVDDYMFFRPSQSEAVFLQFGNIAVYDDGKIIDFWSIFDQVHTTSDSFSDSAKKPVGISTC